MSDYRGNFYSTDAYNPQYAAKIVSGMQGAAITIAAANANKLKLDSDTHFGDFVFLTVYRSVGNNKLKAIPPSYTLSWEGNDLYLTGDEDYNLSAGDFVVYQISKQAEA